MPHRGQVSAAQQALAYHGIDAKPSSTPHMALLYDLYDRRHIALHPVEPVHWKASEISLVLCHIGKHRHQRIGRWPLHPTSP